MGLLSHKILQIVKGVGPTPGDTTSAEQPLVALDLLDSGSGISLDLEDGWEPNIPSLKSGGVWADSPISDGRTLIAGVNTNVTETMRLIVSARNAKVYAASFASLQRMIQDCRAFWDTNYQIEPAYLLWWAAGAPGPQAARIFNIDMDLKFADSEDADATITLTIEREYGWTGVRPGGNPKEWTAFVRGTKFSVTNAALIQASSTDLVTKSSVVNRREWSNVYVAVLSSNYIDISADLIPGDLPARVCLSFAMNTIVCSNSILIGKSTKPASLRTPSNTDRVQSYVLNAADAIVGTDTTLAADTGSPRQAASTNQRSQTTFVTATLQTRLVWAKANGNIDFSVMRGRFAMFLRARVSAAAAVSLQITMEANSSVDVFTSDTYALSDLGVGGVGNTTEWAFIYMGIVNIPFAGDVVVGPEGTGIQVMSNLSNDFQINLNASRASGAGSLYVADLIFMPIDEGAVLYKPAITTSTLATPHYFVIDGTGYLSHGKDAFSGIYVLDVSQYVMHEFTQPAGSELTLTPKVDNRLHYIFYNPSTLRSNITEGGTLGVNIIPQWSGIRDA